MMQLDLDMGNYEDCLSEDRKIFYKSRQNCNRKGELVANPNKIFKGKDYHNGRFYTDV